MKAAVRRLLRDEAGRAILLSLLLLATGGLITTPLLGLMTAGLTAGHVCEQKTHELYSSDAGVEYAIWYLQHGGDPDDVPELTLNGKDVTIQIDKLDTPCGEPPIYDITSTATSEGGSSTTVLAEVSGIIVIFEGDKDLMEGEGLEGDVYVEQNLFMDNESVIEGNVMAGGNVIMNAGSLIGGVLCAGGDLTLNEGAHIQMDVYVGGNILMQGGSIGSSIDGDVYAQGNVEMQGESWITGTLWSGSNETAGVQIDKHGTIYEDVHVRYLEVVEASGQILGEIYEDYYDHYCPLVLSEPEILCWLII